MPIFGKIIFVIGFFGLGLFLSLQNSPQIASRNPAQFEAEEDYYKDFAASPQDLSFKELTEILNHYKFSKIQDLLAYLKEKKPEYMRHYSLVYESKSLHESSFQNPRAIVFGKGARTIISFNGSPQQVGYEMLEVANFNEHTSKFEFYEIEFNEKGQLSSVGNTISNNGGPNNKCLVCHINGQPQWHSYAVWPGVYGTEDDFPIYSGDANEQGRKTFSSLGTESQRKVIDQWLNFKANGLTSGRYKNLNPLAPSPTEATQQHPQPRPNTDFTVALSFLNYKRIHRLLLDAGADREPTRNLLMYGQFCENANKYLAESNNGSAQKILQIHNDWQKIAVPKAKEVLIDDFLQLERNFQMNWADVENYLNNGGGNFKYWTRSQSPNAKAFYGKVLSELNTDIKSFAAAYPGNSIQESFLLSLVDRFLPQARPLTWPMNYKGNYDFNNGVEVTGEFDKIVTQVTNLNSTHNEFKGLNNQDNQDTLCKKLLDKIEQSYLRTQH